MMKIADSSTPVVIVNCKLAALGIMRSLGSNNVAVYGVDRDHMSPGMASRYCRKKYLMSLNGDNQAEFLEYLLKTGREIGRPSILIPTSDETSVFVAENADALSEFYIFPKNDPELVKNLISKKEMYSLALKHNVPTAYTEFPRNLDDVMDYVKRGKFPVMLKGIHGNRLQERTGKKMVIVNTANELIENYKLLEDKDSPNIMLQEYIPGDDDQIYIFNGYFDKNSECLAAFTGHKIRQFPIHVGCASLGVCKWNETVSRITVEFMKAIGYKGILDIGYRFDPRDGLYKVLDINPRIGQAFRLFLSENGMDVARALYLDLTGQERFPIVPVEGRRWIIEDFDLVSSLHYYKEGTLTISEWLRSFKGVEEGAWFSWKDPRPFFIMVSGLINRTITNLKKRLGFGRAVTARAIKGAQPGTRIGDDHG